MRLSVEQLQHSKSELQFLLQTKTTEKTALELKQRALQSEHEKDQAAIRSMSDELLQQKGQIQKQGSLISQCNEKLKRQYEDLKSKTYVLEQADKRYVSLEAEFKLKSSSLSSLQTARPYRCMCSIASND